MKPEQVKDLSPGNDNGATATQIKPKLSKFKKLINFTISTALVCTVSAMTWGTFEVAYKVWEMEIPMISSAPLSNFGLDVKNSFDANHSYLIKTFAKDPEIERIKNLKIKTRINFSFSNKLSINDDAHAVAKDNYINISVPQMQKKYDESLSIKEKINTARNQGKSSYLAMEQFFMSPGGEQAVYNFFLNVEDTQKILIPDYIYFHEFTHVYLDSRLEALNKAIEQEFAVNKLTYSKINEGVLGESTSDALGIMLTIDKHNLNQADSISFIEARMAHRFTARVTVQTKQDRIEHDTEFAIYSLLNKVKSEGVEKIKAMPIEEKVNLAIDYGQQSMHYSNFTTKNKFGDKDTIILSQKIFPKDKNDLYLMKGPLLDRTGQEINDISQKRSFFMKAINSKNNKDENEAVKPLTPGIKNK